MPEVTFGTELRRLRRQANLNLVDLADACGISIAYVSEIERGRRNPPDRATIRKMLVRMGHEDLLEEMLVLASRARRFIEISMKDQNREAADVLGTLARECDEGKLDDEFVRALRELLEKRRMQ